MKHEQLTSKILECCFEVVKELGAGFLASVYEKALVVALTQKGINVGSQMPLKVEFRGVIVGDFIAGLLVNFGTPKIEYFRLHPSNNPANPVNPV